MIGRIFGAIILVATVTVLQAQLQGETIRTPDTLTPILEPNLAQKKQPFAGQVRFGDNLVIGQPCTVAVELTSLARLDSTQWIRLARIYPYPIKIEPESLAWEGPIDSSDTYRGFFTFTPNEVGTYQFICGHKLGNAWQNIAKLALAFDEDGMPLFAGAGADCRFTVVPPHPLRDLDTIVIDFPPKAETSDPRFERHFTAEFRFHPAPALKETTFVDFTLECRFSLYSEVQFILDHSSSLKPSELPESWGNRAGPTEGYRYYHGSFSFVPLAWGIQYLDFKVMGSRPMLKNVDRPTTEFPIYFVIAEDGSLKFIGYNSPWDRYVDATDPMLGTVTGLVEIDRREFRTSHVRSKPDFVEMEQKATMDSLKSSSESESH